MNIADDKKLALVLGGAGFIGGHMAKKLKEEGYWVRVVDIKDNHEFWDHDLICDEYMQGDLRDPQFTSLALFSPKQHSLEDTANAFDVVYQFASDMGGAGYVFTEENDANIMHNSALVNLNVCEAAVKFNVNKVLYTSSACIYPEELQLEEDDVSLREPDAYPANPDSEYGWEKLFSERLYMSFAKNYNLDVSIVRLHNIFGPQGTWCGGREKAPAALCRKVAKADEGEDVEVWGDGKQTRSFLYVDECVEGLKRMVDSDFMGPVNLGSDEMISINGLVEMIIDISDKDDIDMNHINGPEGVRGRNSNNEMIEEKLGWRPTQPLRAGMEKTYKWIKQEVDAGKEQEYIDQIGKKLEFKK